MVERSVVLETLLGAVTAAADDDDDLPTYLAMFLVHFLSQTNPLLATYLRHLNVEQKKNLKFAINKEEPGRSMRFQCSRHQQTANQNDHCQVWNQPVRQTFAVTTQDVPCCSGSSDSKTPPSPPPPPPPLLLLLLALLWREGGAGKPSGAVVVVCCVILSVAVVLYTFRRLLSLSISVVSRTISVLAACCCCLCCAKLLWSCPIGVRFFLNYGVRLVFVLSHTATADDVGFVGRCLLFCCIFFFFCGMMMFDNNCWGYSQLTWLWDKPFWFISLNRK